MPAFDRLFVSFFRFFTVLIHLELLVQILKHIHTVQEFFGTCSNINMKSVIGFITCIKLTGKLNSFLQAETIKHLLIKCRKVLKLLRNCLWDNIVTKFITKSKSDLTKNKLPFTSNVSSLYKLYLDKNISKHKMKGLQFNEIYERITTKPFHLLKVK